MALAATRYDQLVRNVWAPQLESVVFHNDALLGGNLFPVVDSPGGTTISHGYKYSISTNAGTFGADDPMVEPFTSSEIRAYFNKDFFQESIRVLRQDVANAERGGLEVGMSIVKDATETGVKNLLDIATTTMIADLEAQIDSSTAYSDASLSRTTYAALKSYEEATSTGLTLAHVEDLVEALMTHVTYGQQVRNISDLLWLVPRNQLTNWSRLMTGGSNFEFTASSQNMAPIDAGRVFRTQRFEGIDIVPIPDMTSTVLLCVHKPDIKIYRNQPLVVESKEEKAFSWLWHLVCGYNIVCKCPGNSAKLSAKTA